MITTNEIDETYQVLNRNTPREERDPCLCRNNRRLCNQCREVIHRFMSNEAV